MKISERTVKRLGEIITGDKGLSPYRGGPKLVSFFNECGTNHTYGQGFPSRWMFAEECIRQFNGTPTMKKIILSAVDPRDFMGATIGNTDGTPVEMDSVGPAFEFNWGALPRLQLHAVLPWGSVNPSNNPVYLPAGTGSSTFGLTDIEVGAKIAFIEESKHIPQIGSFPMFEMPTGNYDRGLGVGKVWYKSPIWLQKNEGKWLFDGGGGYQSYLEPATETFPTLDGS